MRIVNMLRLNQAQIVQAAQILTDSIPEGWPTLRDSLAEIETSLASRGILLAALEGNIVLGWGGALPSYDGNVFELHPLAVRSERRNEGIARALVLALEAQARQLGGLTMYLGADDELEGGETSLANVDLYDRLSDRIAAFAPGTHHSAFYLKLGYKIIGVMPDANGPGKPDIFLAKRL